MLVADKNMQFALRGALGRPQALGTRPLTWDIRPHMGRDGGVRTSGADMLACDAGRFSHALMLLDFQGCGHEERETPLSLEGKLDEQLQRVWGSRAKCIVIAPEVDIWLWGSDRVLHEALQWSTEESIRDWLRHRGFEFDAAGKPLQPKEAIEPFAVGKSGRGLRPSTRASRDASVFNTAPTRRSSDCERSSLPGLRRECKTSRQAASVGWAIARLFL